MSRIFIALVLSLASVAANAQWQQWGRDPQHTGASPVAGQPPVAIFADYVYDPFLDDEQFAGGGDLLAHFQVPIIDGDDVFMEVKSGAYSFQTWSTASSPRDSLPSDSCSR